MTRKHYYGIAEQNAVYAVGISAGFPSSSAGASSPFRFPFSQVFWLWSLLTLLCEPHRTLVKSENTTVALKQECTSQEKDCEGSKRKAKVYCFVYKIMR